MRLLHPKRDVLKTRDYYERMLTGKDKSFMQEAQYKSSMAFKNELDKAFKELEEQQRATEDLVFQKGAGHRIVQSMSGADPDEMLVQGKSIILLGGFHNIDGRDKFHFIGSKALADAAERMIRPNLDGGVSNKGLLVLTLVDQGGDNFIQTFLRIAAVVAFDEEPLAARDDPLFPQFALYGGTGGEGICGKIRDFIHGTGQLHITDSIPEIVGEEVDLLPAKIRIQGLDPVVVGQTETQILLQIGVGRNADALQNSADIALADGNGPPLPPFAKHGGVDVSAQGKKLRHTGPGGFQNRAGDRINEDAAHDVVPVHQMILLLFHVSPFLPLVILGDAFDCILHLEFCRFHEPVQHIGLE